MCPGSREVKLHPGVHHGQYNQPLFSARVPSPQDARINMLELKNENHVISVLVKQLRLDEIKIKQA